jgi:CubicO group peptidase (beta-lactamase class C family)
MQKTDNWTEHILMTSFEEDPGSRYEYSNYASFLLSAIIQKSTGQDTLEFAKENLFSPLGIDDVTWENSPEGVGIGWARMWLKPKDMAKIGQLYLQKGNWDGQQVISSQWIDDTLTAHSQPKKYRKVYNEQGKWDFMMSSGDWVGTNLNRPFADGYGYQFWLDKSGAYSAVGTGGQYIIVTPKENLVVVFTSKLSGDDAFYPKKLFDMIFESIVSDGAISADQEAQSKLSLLSRPLKVLQEAEPVPDLPSTVAKISGETYELGENYWEYDNLRFVFEKGCDYAEIEYDARASDKVRYQIGLDGTYKLSKCNDRTYAATGKWETADTFVFSLEVVGYSTKDEWRLTFVNDIVQVEEIGVTGTQSYIGTQSE